MSIFKKSKAISYDSMNSLKRVIITEDKVSFTLNYSNIDLAVEDIPGLLSDIIEVYSHVKPSLDKKSEELEAQKYTDSQKTEVPVSTDSPIDLSNIPF